MRTLLINPQMPYSFWTLESTCQLTGVKTLAPPLGLLTVAALLPDTWELRLVDLNTRALSEADWQWAEVVLIGGMLIQRTGLLDLVQEANKRGKTVIVGGPYPTIWPREVFEAGADIVVQGEIESLIESLVQAVTEKASDLILKSEERPSMALSPVPRFDLINCNDYVVMNIQTSRGCPYNCEFCDVIKLFGRQPRYKNPDQVLAELKALYTLGWRGPVFISDDNFIGNKAHARAILDKLIPWMHEHGEPFYYWTQTSVNLGNDVELIDLLTDANFSTVFIGVESTDAEVLSQTGKHHNKSGELNTWINAIKTNGLEVVASFILGFDSETAGTDARICRIVEACNLPMVMINLLEALPGTEFWKRLELEGRLHQPAASLGLSEGTLNFIPQRPAPDILAEWQRTIMHLYKPENYLTRAYHFILDMRPTRSFQAGRDGRRTPPADDNIGSYSTARYRELRGAALLFWRQGMKAPYRRQFWRQLWDIWRHNPSRLKKYLRLCSLGENGFVLRERVRCGLAGGVASSMHPVD